MSGTDKKNQEATALLVSYAAGVASEQERAAVEADAARDPDMAARLALAETSRDALQASEVEMQDSWSPGEIGYRRLMREIEREAAPKRVGWMNSAPLWQGLAAAAAVALVVVSALRFDGVGPTSGQNYAPATSGPGAAVSAATVQITFAPTATEAEIRALLLQVKAQLVEGPSALGLYRAAFADDAAREAGVAQLQAADIVESAETE
ncbi:MAG: hypothetical protein KTR21_01015 [Rhodobacteraceae bacterium]|nr:hypothetical protein [Paracoccaceae bacterium]